MAFEGFAFGRERLDELEASDRPRSFSELLEVRKGFGGGASGRTPSGSGPDGATVSMGQKVELLVRDWGSGFRGLGGGVFHVRCGLAFSIWGTRGMGEGLIPVRV